jgi:hypothetical protein
MSVMRTKQHRIKQQLPTSSITASTIPSEHHPKQSNITPHHQT